MPCNSFAFLKAVTTSLLFAVTLFTQFLRAQQMPTASPAGAQTPHITQAIDENVRITLQGNTHPLARAQYDRGQASPALPAERMMLVLQRSTEQESALKQYLEDLHDPTSQSYHKWLGPEQFGQLYGPADADIQTVTGWLQQQGFSVNKVLKGRTAIEFSGTMGQVQNAFHTSIHHFVVNGEQHFANATDPQIPAALSPVVKGVMSLNNFSPKPMVKVLGRMTLDPKTHRATPQFNVPSGGGSSYFLAVTPGDFNTIYDVTPLLSAGTDGTGVTIGVVGDSNINLTHVNNYRSAFGLPANTPNVVVDGNDPGITSDDVEAYLDVELAGAVAPKATINFYTAADTALSFGFDLALIRAIEDDQVQILNISFGACEADLGKGGNALINSLYEQAAAAGVAIVVASGDSGSAACDNPNSESSAALGLAVSGFASTPYNVAVGGTDFYYSDPSKIFGTYWKNPSGTSPNNNADYSSALTYIPEKVWNDSDPTGNQTATVPNISAGGGGPSTCQNLTTTGNATSCIGGYPKPSWQTGTGVPADGVRDVPDVSLFSAGSGLNYSLYAICASTGDCPANVDPNSLTSPLPFTAVGGTSAASPAMAGILALVVQKYGSQGLVNTVLYPLAAQKPESFHDITVAGNAVACTPSSPNCTGPLISGFQYLSGYSAGTGYDLATGLGSVDVNKLVTDWNSISFKSTTTSLSVSPTSIAHGQTVTFNVTVSGTGGTPTGNFAILTNSALPAQGLHGQGTLTQGGNTASMTSQSLPGGTYGVMARYAGDGIFAPSTSPSTTITVSSENSAVALYDTASGARITQISTVNVDYGTTLAVEAGVYPASTSAPSNLSAFPLSNTTAATGSITVKDGSAVVGVFPLAVTGTASINLSTLAPGMHTLVLSYNGDASYNPSDSSSLPIPVSVAMSATGASLQSSSSTVSSSGTFALTVVISSLSAAVQPTGTVTFLNGTQTLGTAQLTAAYSIRGASIATASLPVSGSSLTAGVLNNLTASYSGDANYAASTSNSAAVNVTPAVAGTTTTQVSMPSVSGGTFQLTVTVTGAGAGSTAPTGIVTFFTAGSNIGSAMLAGGSGATAGATATFSVSQNLSAVVIGTNPIIAQYAGDENYAGSSGSTTLRLSAIGFLQDYSLLPTPAANAIKAGSSSTFGLAVTPVNAYMGAVTLACATPSGFPGTCSLSASSVQLDGSNPQQVTATIAVNAPTGALDGPRLWMTGGAMLAAVFLFSIPARRRSWQNALGLLLLLMVVIGGTGACGGGGTKSSSDSGGSAGSGGSGGSGGTGGTGGSDSSSSSSSYNVVVTATATDVPDQGTVIHNTVLRVTVQ
jgi:Pro-kumamolisin, activation domain/Bacterial Ig-like domain (group 3)